MKNLGKIAALTAVAEKEVRAAMHAARRGIIPHANSGDAMAVNYYGIESTKPEGEMVVYPKKAYIGIRNKFFRAEGTVGFSTPCDLWYQGVSGVISYRPHPPCAMILSGRKSWVDNGYVWSVTPEGRKNAARLAGYMLACDKYPALRRAFKAAFTARGMGYDLSIADMFKRLPSPGAMDNRVRAIKWRAEQILRNTGVKPSWKAVAYAAAKGCKATGKASVQCAAASLMGDGRWIVGYKQARDMLVTLMSRVQHSADGVDCFVSAAPVAVIHGVSVSVAWQLAGNGVHRKPLYIVSRGDDVYHAEWRVNSEKSAVREAVSAWRARRCFMRADGVYVDQNVTVLATRKDSYAVGNCEIGTERFIVSNGWKSKVFIPVNWLFGKGALAELAAQHALRQFVAKTRV